MHTGSENGRDAELKETMRMIPATALRKICLVIPLMFLSVSAFAQSPPSKILYVGAISINPCQDAKVLADWYSRFGIETREYKGGYYGKLDTAAGLFAFGIHPKKADAPQKCSASLSVVYRVENFESSLSALKSKGLVPDKIEKDDTGQFAHFHDPDGNEVTIWGK
jgi:predicted enzyme related to lactoylglutathione lyase